MLLPEVKKLYLRVIDVTIEEFRATLEETEDETTLQIVDVLKQRWTHHLHFRGFEEDSAFVQLSSFRAKEAREGRVSERKKLQRKK